MATLLLIGAGLASAQPAPEPLAGIAESIASGNAADARKKLAGVLEDAQRRQDTTGEGLGLLLRGIADVALDDAAAARDDFANSRSRFDAVRDHFGAWLALLALAELEHAEARYDAAIAAYRDALAVLGRAAAPGETLTISHVTVLGGYAGLGPLPKMGEVVAPELIKPVLLLFLEPLTRDGHFSALVDAGRLTEAEAELNTLRQTAHRLGGMQDASIAVHAGDLRRRQWRFDDARAEYLRALSASRMRVPFVPQDDTFDLRILRQLAELEVLTGHTDEALSWNDRALALTRAAKNLRRETGVLHERGNLLYRAGRFDGAAAALEQALRTADLARAPGRRGEILFDLALLDLTRGRYGTAVSRYEKAIRSFREAADRIGESGAWIMLSHTYSLMDLRAQAQSAMKRAEEVAAGSAPLPASRLAAALASLAQRHLAGEAIEDELADVLFRIASSAEARDSLWDPSTAETILRFVTDPRSAVEQTSLPPELMLFYGTMQSLARGRQLIDRGEHSAARAVLQKGLEINPSREFRAAFLALIGLSWAAEGNAEAAERALNQAAGAFDLVLQDIRVEELLAGYLGSGRTVYFEVLVESLLARGDVARAFEITERARARAFLQLVGNARVAAGRGADPELVREAEALRMQLASRAGSLVPARPETVAEDVRELRLRYESLLTRMKTTSSEYAALTAVHPAGVAEIAAELPADTTLISYFATRWGVHAWLVGRSTVHHVLLPGGAEAMVEAACWAGRLGRRRGVVDPQRTSPCRDSAEALHGLLFAPLRAKVATRRLVVVPHGALHYVPFAALRDRQTGRLLIDDYTLSYIPSASALRFVNEKETPVGGSALVVGNAGGDLLDAQREVMQIAAALGATPLVGADATESRLYSAGHDVDLVHVAAHGHYDSDHPLFSSISLAPGGGRDGNLEVHEILGELDLTGVNLFVLAACEGAAGKRSGGDDIVGLTRALLYAGTPGVIAAQWKVPDDATAELMNEFYCRLLDGDRPADALRFAQLALAHGDRFKAPEQWAGFALYGNPRGSWARQPVVSRAPLLRDPEPDALHGVTSPEATP